MPLDGGLWEREKVLFAAEILERIAREIGPLEPAADQDPRAPAIDYDYVDGGGRVGLIASVSRPFCMSCNRVRLTSDGKLRNCLFSLDETDIRGLLRGDATEAEVAEAVRALGGRQVGRPRDQHRPLHPARPADALDRRVKPIVASHSKVLSGFGLGLIGGDPRPVEPGVAEGEHADQEDAGADAQEEAADDAQAEAELGGIDLSPGASGRAEPADEAGGQPAHRGPDDASGRAGRQRAGHHGDDRLRQSNHAQSLLDGHVLSADGTLAPRCRGRACAGRLGLPVRAPPREGP